MDLVFKALADPNRRRLLDQLHDQDGQTLSELERHLPHMTRFGVMKHLKVLEDAGLVSTRRVGREKFHYLNPVPIQQMHDRWMTRFTTHAAVTLIDLKRSLEEVPMSEHVPSKVFDIFITTSAEELWKALTEGEFTRQYYYGTAVESSWEKGAPYAYKAPDGSDALIGEVLESDPPRRLAMTFDALFVPERQAPSTVTFEIEPRGEVCRLTVVHEGLQPGELAESVTLGWPEILSGLKTLLETGRPMPALAD